jgi:nitrate reductase NapE component
MFGMYWAFFFAGLLSLVCMFSLRHIKTRLNLFRLWLLVFISTSVAAFIDFYPSLVYWGKYGATSVVGRSIIQNDFWPFRVMDLVLFPTYSIVKIPLFSRSVLQNSPVSGEASGLFAPLGIVVLLLAIILLGKSLRSGMSSAVADYGLSEDKISKDQLMFLVLGLVLIPSVGSVGGFGTILNNFGVSPIKSWERIAVVFQILALNFVVIFLNNYGTFLRTRDTKVRSQGMKPRGLRGNAVSIVLVVATFFTLISSIPVGWDNDFGVTKSIFDSDRSFFHQVEEVVGDGMVFSFPVETFPEGPEACTSIPYASLIGNMYTQKVRWSSGAVRGRDSEWQTVMNGIPLEQSVNRLADLGFTGVIIDRRGYSPEAFQVLMEEITSHLNDMPLLSKDSRWVFTEIEDFFKNNDSEQTNNGYERVVRTKESTAALSAGVSASSPAYTCSRP